MRQARTAMEIAAAKNLKRIFEEKKYGPERLTQKRLADKVGIRQQTAVSQYVSGRNTLGVEAVAKFAAALEVPPEEIRPDFYELLQLTRQQSPSASVVVRSTFSGKKPPIKAILTQIEKNEGAVGHYAILIDSNKFRNARIRQGAHIVVAEGLEPGVDDDVFIVTTDNDRYIGSVLNQTEDTISFSSFADGETVMLERSTLRVFDIIEGVQNPARK